MRWSVDELYASENCVSLFKRNLLLFLRLFIFGWVFSLSLCAFICFMRHFFGWYLLTHYYFMSVVRHDGKYLHFFEVIVLIGFFWECWKMRSFNCCVFLEWVDRMPYLKGIKSVSSSLMVSRVLFKQLPFDVLHKRSTIKSNFQLKTLTWNYLIWIPSNSFKDISNCHFFMQNPLIFPINPKLCTYAVQLPMI